MQKFDNSHHSTCDTEYLDESDPFASHEELRLV